MHVIHGRNVNDAYQSGLRFMSEYGIPSDSRNGRVLRIPDPVATVYRRPQERVLFSAQRDANPFFHLFEALWMLNGNNDVATMDQFLSSFKTFSDDGETFYGAYGHRWRHWPRSGGPDFDQLRIVIAALKRNPDDRRVIIGMWDPERDLMHDGKDVPCNTTIKVGIVQGVLKMIVFCRSNDIIFGAYGANAVHMSFLQEYLARCIGVPMGSYTQISADYHAYVDTPYRWDRYFPLQDDGFNYVDTIVPYKLVHAPVVFDEELFRVVQKLTDGTMLDSKLCGFQNTFFHYVALPMYKAHRLHKDGQTMEAISLLQHCNVRKIDFEPNNDWLMAGIRWLQRRIDNRAREGTHVTA